MKPALTAEEWARYAERDRFDIIEMLPVPFGVTAHSETSHAIAALCLHGEPFGFTHEMLSDVRHETEGYTDEADDTWKHRTVAVLDWAAWEAIRDRIEALLPPKAP